MSTPLHRSSLRSITARLHRRETGRFVDRNTTPTDFVLRDYRYIR